MSPSLSPLHVDMCFFWKLDSCLSITLLLFPPLPQPLPNTHTLQTGSWRGTVCLALRGNFHDLSLHHHDSWEQDIITLVLQMEKLEMGVHEQIAQGRHSHCAPRSAANACRLPHSPVFLVLWDLHPTLSTGTTWPWSFLTWMAKSNLDSETKKKTTKKTSITHKPLVYSLSDGHLSHQQCQQPPKKLGEAAWILP